MKGKSDLSESQILLIYRESIDSLYGYVSRKCGGDRSLAEDVTQETWLRAVREWRRKGVPDEPIAWLTTVARNLLASYFRRRPLTSVAPDGMLEALPDRRPSESSDAAAVVDHALAQLPVNQAQILEAFHLEDRRTAQIAESMGVSERAVEGRLRRARQRLRRELEAVMRIAGGKR